MTTSPCLAILCHLFYVMTYLLSLDITRSGEFFVTGSNDKTLKLWSYDEGEMS